MVHELEIAYRIANWRDDPYSPDGRERYVKALDRFEKLLEHPWFNDVSRRKSVSIVDIGAGKGIGGVALAKILNKHGVRTKLHMIDVRRDALKVAVRFASEENVEAYTYVVDAREAYKLSLRNNDIALMYGSILAHFNEWDLVKLLASTMMLIKDNGLLIIEELDRDHILYTRGYKDLLIESRDEDKISLSIHMKYDPITSSYHRLFIDLIRRLKARVTINFRSIAQIASLLWVFMEDIDIVYTGEGLIYYILGFKPRRINNVKDLVEPEILKRNSFWNL